ADGGDAGRGGDRRPAAPSFSLGASAGAAVAVGLGAAGAPVSVAALALVGAGAALAVTQRAPVFAAVFVWELTRGPVWTLPVLLAACLLAVGPRPGAGRGPRRARS
ncbi:MAG: chloride channel protein, partial [Actinomyces dentalis]